LRLIDNVLRERRAVAHIALADILLVKKANMVAVPSHTLLVLVHRKFLSQYRWAIPE